MRYPKLTEQAALKKACKEFIYPYLKHSLTSAIRVVETIHIWATDDADIAALFHYNYAGLKRVIDVSFP